VISGPSLRLRLPRFFLGRLNLGGAAVSLHPMEPLFVIIFITNILQTKKIVVFYGLALIIRSLASFIRCILKDFQDGLAH